MFAFYDPQQRTLIERGVGPWVGTFAWKAEKAQVKVPSKTSHCIIRVGLLGGVVLLFALFTVRRDMERVSRPVVA